MKKDYLENIAQNYDLLVPKDKETLLLLISLSKKIKSGEIEQEFSQHDFETSLFETQNILQRDESIQFENISKRLSQYFYTTIKDTETPYQLTVYARELCDLIENQIEPEYAKLSLRQTFKRTLPLTDNDILNIENFEYWFKIQFTTSKKIINSHIENLQRFVDSQISELGSVLKVEFENVKDKLETFLQTLKKVSEKSEDLTETLNFKTDIIKKIQTAEEIFKDNKSDWEKYITIQNEVIYFFENIDKRVLAINEKIQTARIRLKSLFKELRYKRQYKIKLEKFLQHILENSKNEKGKITLPVNIKKKRIPYLKQSLSLIPNIDFGDISPIKPPSFEIDEKFEKEQKVKAELILKKQESIAKWIGKINKLLESGETIDYSQWFNLIYEEEKQYDIPVEVCYGLIEKYSKDGNNKITIDKNNPYIKKSEIVLWNMKIEPLNF